MNIKVNYFGKNRKPIFMVQHQSKPYFFANNVFWILGHKLPHLIMKRIPKKQQISIPGLYGIFLSKDYINELQQFYPNKASFFSQINNTV